MPDTATQEIPEKMLAAVLRTADSIEFSLEHIPVPRPLSGEVLVRVAACGVCHSDLHVAKGEIAFPRPAVLGHELSGRIVEVGQEVDNFSTGDDVVAGFIMPCTQCKQCLQGRDDICEVFFKNNRLGGNLLDGTSRLTDSEGNRLNMYSSAGFAEYAVVPSSALVKVSPNLDLVTSSILGCAGMTGYGAVTRAAGDINNSSVCIIGVGGIGLSITQLVASLGATTVIAVDINEQKLELAKSLGATHTVNAKEVPDVVQVVLDITGGVNVAFDALGSPVTLKQVMAVLAEGGRGIAVGLSSSDALVEVPINALVRRGLSLQGSFGARTRQDLPAVEELASNGGFPLSNIVTNYYPLNEINTAYKELAEGKILGRGVIVMDEDLLPH